MITIETFKNGYRILEQGWIIATVGTIHELRETLRQIINYRYGDNNQSLKW